MVNRLLIMTFYAGTVLASGAITAFAQQTQSGGSSADTITEIVVTARRTEELLQDVPISIAVFNQQQLANANVVTAGDLAAYTPSLSVTNTFGSDNVSFAIRGFVEAGFTSPSVGVYFADVIAPRANGGTTAGNGAGPGNFFDLQNVQVLKGPQGTLFGRNTTGGSILLVPKKPTDQFEGYLEQSVGNYDMERTQAVINAPLDDKVWFRFGIDHQTRDGYLHNLSGIGPNNFADVNYTAVRGSVVLNITDSLENYTIVTYSDSDTNGDYPKAFGYTPGASLVTDLGANIGAEIKATSGNFYDVENGRPDARQHVTQWGISNTTTWTASDQLTVKNIASYAQFYQDQSTNIFGESGSSVLPNPPGSIPYIVSIGTAPGADNVSESTATEELQAHGEIFGGRLSYQGGVYGEVSLPLNGFQAYYTPILASCTNPNTFQCTDVLGTAFGIPGFVGSESLSASKYKFTDYAVYTQETYKITDELSLTAGVRYTLDRSTGLGEVLHVTFPQSNTPNFGCSFPVPLVKGGTSAQIEFNHSLCDYQTSVGSHAPTWLFDLEYKPWDNVMLYAKDARGYRQGSINVSLFGLGNWKPEQVDTYEVGAKTSFDSFVRGTFDIAAFYNDFTDQQLQVNEVACTPQQLGSPQCPYLGTPAAGIANAGSSTIEGVELDTAIVPFHGARLNFDYTYLYTKLNSVTIPQPPLGFTSVNFPSTVGGPLPYAPRNKFTVTGSYRLPLEPSYGPITVSATYSHQSTEFNTETAPPGFQTLSAQSNLNLDLNWNNMFGRPFDLSVFATNVTGEKYLEASDGIYSSFGYDVAYLNPPTMYGARLRYHFGD